jgi:hypothetical protein
MADELASANIPRAVERESAACVARNVKCRQTGRAEIIAQHTDAEAGTICASSAFI